jgi:predicted nucleic acid-binding Zn ribbon protein
VPLVKSRRRYTSTKSPVTGLREAVIRVATINPGPAIKALEAQGFTVGEPWRG